MGKGYKRKTRWRTLNIADCATAPPADEDDEDGGIRRGREHATRNAQSTQKSHNNIRSDKKTENGVVDNSSGGSPSRSQPKILFDENEYTRITAPRQDVLFKKGYLAKKKVWSGNNNASTSATPSTTESQSASHSTADGSETTEDQQFLDCRDNGLEEYSHAETQPPAQMTYGTFYDHASGYYYEYPVMVVGPPVPGPPMHNLLAAMPCEAVPLRPIEWVNPAYVPKYEQPYCLVDYQNPQVDQPFTVAPEEPELVAAPLTTPTTTTTPAPAAISETIRNAEEPLENGTNNGWAESNGAEKPNDEEGPLSSSYPAPNSDQPPNLPEYAAVEEEIVDNGYANDSCLETVLAQQLHVSHHHVIPPVPQPYMYPGHYMFGSTLVNVNGMTIQSGPIIRTNEIPVSTSTFARRKKKKKLSKRKMRRPLGQENFEYCGHEEEDYSSEADNVGGRVASSNTFTTSGRPLNPNCKEFEFRPSSLASQATGSVTSLSNSVSMSTVISDDHIINEQPAAHPQLDLKSQNSIDTSCKSMTPDVHESPTETPAVVTNVEFATEAIAANESNQINGLDGEIIQETEVGVDVTCEEFNDIIKKLEDNNLSDKNPALDVSVPNGNGDCERLTNGAASSGEGTNEYRDLAKANGPEVAITKNQSRKKYKSTKITREATPGPDFNDQQHQTSPSKVDLPCHIDGVVMGVDAIEAQLNADASNEDSGFESQTRYSDHPITDAVTQWLRRANSPDMFITTTTGNDANNDTDDDDELDDEGCSEPSKNLQGNPMPALSANSSGASDVKTSKRSYGEFARANDTNTTTNDSRINNNAMENKDKEQSISKSKMQTKSLNKKRLAKSKAATKIDDGRQRKKNRKLRSKAKETSVVTTKNNNNNDDNKNGTCEFTEKDSDAGMRVAKNPRINLKINECVVNHKSESSLRMDENNQVNKSSVDGELVETVDGMTNINNRKVLQTANDKSATAKPTDADFEAAATTELAKADDFEASTAKCVGANGKSATVKVTRTGSKVAKAKKNRADAELATTKYSKADSESETAERSNADAQLATVKRCKADSESETVRQIDADAELATVKCSKADSESETVERIDADAKLATLKGCKADSESETAERINADAKLATVKCSKVDSESETAERSNAGAKLATVEHCKADSELEIAEISDADAKLATVKHCKADSESKKAEQSDADAKLATVKYSKADSESEKVGKSDADAKLATVKCSKADSESETTGKMIADAKLATVKCCKDDSESELAEKSNADEKSATEHADNDDENDKNELSDENSLECLDEPDILLECWEPEIVAPVEKPIKCTKYLNDDRIVDKVDNESLEIVRKYYAFARASIQSISSIETGISESDNNNHSQYKSRLISPEQLKLFASDCSVINKNNQKHDNLPIDEGIEIYESCYNGNPPPIIFHSQLYKSRSLYGHDDDGPLPCRANCCIVQ